MATFRTPDTEAAYQKYKDGGNLTQCPLCRIDSLKEFQHWRIVENTFPYDQIAKVHHMLIPKRHVSDEELNTQEEDEFEVIKKEYLHKTYQFLIEATYLQKSIPGHAHLHLILAKD